MLRARPSLRSAPPRTLLPRPLNKPVVRPAALPLAASLRLGGGVQWRWVSSEEGSSKEYRERHGDKPAFILKAERAGKKTNYLLLLFALFPAALLPWLLNQFDKERATEGSGELAEYEEYRKHKRAERLAAAAASAHDNDVVVTAAMPGAPAPTRHYTYVLIGAGTASFHALKAIREKDPEAEVLILGDEDIGPYRRPPLSKELWRSEDPAVAATLAFTDYSGNQASILFVPEGELGRDSGTTFIQNHTVKELDVELKEIVLDDGRRFSYTKCLIATGGTPIQIPGAGEDLSGKVTTFRTAEDFKKLDAVTRVDGSRIAVVGGSFLGTELTSAITSRKKGDNLEVIQIFPEPGVMARNLPRYLSEFVTQKLKDEGVSIMNDTVVENVEPAPNGKVAVHLDNGNTVEVDQVVLAVGISPNTELAEKAGLEIDPKYGGVVANADLEARRDVYVAGDVASYHDGILGRRRVEHYDHAAQSGRRAGLNMSGSPRPYTHMPMFWSDIGNLGYEAVGSIDSSLDTVSFWDTIGVTQSGSLWTFSAAPVKVGGYHKGVVYYLKDNRVVGVLLWNNYGKVDEARNLIKNKTKYENPSELRDKIKLN